MAVKIAKLEEWVEGHEKRCEDRLTTINDAIADVKTTMQRGGRAVWAVAIALLAWGAAQIYDGLKPHPAPAPTFTVQTGTIPPQPPHP
jgi:hypothetical protein